MQIPISAANWYPISASYPYDSNMDLQPSLVVWSDGYTAVTHPLFTNARSIATNKDTMLFLTTATSFFDIVNEPVYDSLSVGSYISLKMGNSYITNISGSLCLSDTTITDNSFFRLIANSNNTYSLMQDNMEYVTVDPYLPFGLTMQTRTANIDISRQSFNVYAPGNGQVYLTTTVNNPFSAYDSTTIQRFWSYNISTSAIQCIGTTTPASSTNIFLFAFEGAGLVTTLNGLTRDQTWVQYYNNVNNTINNKNVEIYASRSVSGINVNRLVELPYSTKITIDGRVGGMEVNIANLKNIMTPEYEYHSKR